MTPLATVQRELSLSVSIGHWPAHRGPRRPDPAVTLARLACSLAGPGRSDVLGCAMALVSVGGKGGGL